MLKTLTEYEFTKGWGLLKEELRGNNTLIEAFERDVKTIYFELEGEIQAQFIVDGGFAKHYLYFNAPSQNDTPDQVLSKLGETNQRLQRIDLEIFFELSQPTGLTLPPDLNTEEVKGIFAQAQKLELMDNNYKWLKSLQLAACFAREMSNKFKLGKGQNSDGTLRINWKVFETLWGLPKGKLRGSYNDIQKTGQDPNGIKDIKKIFN